MEDQKCQMNKYLKNVISHYNTLLSVITIQFTINLYN